jgi:hypothetical protein
VRCRCIAAILHKCTYWARCRRAAGAGNARRCPAERPGRHLECARLQSTRRRRAQRCLASPCQVGLPHATTLMYVPTHEPSKLALLERLVCRGCSRSALGLGNTVVRGRIAMMVCRWRVPQVDATRFFCPAPVRRTTALHCAQLHSQAPLRLHSLPPRTALCGCSGCRAHGREGGREVGSWPGVGVVQARCFVRMLS